MKDPIEYQHFAGLVERVAVYTERLENICRNLEQYKVEHKSDIKNLDDRLRALEDQANKYSGNISVARYIGAMAIGAAAWAITTFIHYHAVNFTM